MCVAAGLNIIHVCTMLGQPMFQFGRWGEQNGMLKSPGGMAVDAHGNVLSADSDNNRLQVRTHGAKY